MNPDPDAVAELRRALGTNVPQIASGIVEIRGLARQRGTRSCVVVSARDQTTDAVGAVVGTRGSRIKAIVAELGGEKVDVVRWSDSIEQFLGNLFAPNKLLQVRFDKPNRRATIALRLDVIDAASTMRLKLASELLGWKLDFE